MARTRIQAFVEEDVKDAIEDSLEYGDSRSDWVRTAVHLRLDKEGLDVPDEVKEAVEVYD